MTITDPAYVRHTIGKPWLQAHCTCRTSPSGERYFACMSTMKGRECNRRGQACGGYCQPCFSWMMQQPSPLTFAALMAINVERCQRWHPGFPDDDTWTLSDWSNAMAGEAGEACNVVKKIRRYETGQFGLLDPPEEDLKPMLAHEIADVLLYAFLLAHKAGIDLEQAVREKFNIVSERQDFPERLPVSSPPPTPGP